MNKVVFGEKVLVCVESLHNIPIPWEAKYKGYYVEINLMFGLKSYGKMTTHNSYLTLTHGFTFVIFSSWVVFRFF